MRYTFELSYHHNNPMLSRYFSIMAKNDKEATAKAFLKAMEYMWKGNHPEGSSFEELFPIKLNDLLPLVSRSNEKIFKVTDDYIDPGEAWYIHVWNMYEDKHWNRGFGVGGAEPNTTDKYENIWISMANKGTPTTKEELVDAIEGLTYDLNKLSRDDLLFIYRRLASYSNL
jgi:hypothetical protein